MIRAGNRAGARRQRIAFRDSCESPICIRRGVSPQLLHSRLTVLVATATHSRLEPLLVRAAHFPNWQKAPMIRCESKKWLGVRYLDISPLVIARTISASKSEEALPLTSKHSSSNDTSN